MDRLLKDADIQEFQRLAKEHCSVDLTAEKAVNTAGRLLRVLHVVWEVTLNNTATKTAPSQEQVPASTTPKRSGTQGKLF